MFWLFASTVIYLVNFHVFCLIFRRLKSDVLDQLPEKQRKIVGDFAFFVAFYNKKLFFLFQANRLTPSSYAIVRYHGQA